MGGGREEQREGGRLGRGGVAGHKTVGSRRWGENAGVREWRTKEAAIEAHGEGGDDHRGQRRQQEGEKKRER